MTKSRIARHHRTIGRVLPGLLALVFAGSAGAWQTTPSPPIKPVQPIVIQPSADLRFQQVVQQQKVRDQLQQSQVEQQLHRDVANNARRPTATDPKLQQQQDQAAQAQLERDRARQQDLLDHYRQTPVLPRVIPKDLPEPDQDIDNR